MRGTEKRENGLAKIQKTKSSNPNRNNGKKELRKAKLQSFDEDAS